MKVRSKKSEVRKDGRLVPRLRFPEFRDGPGWEEKSVNAISDVNPNHEGLPDSFVYIDLESVEQGKLVTQNVIDRDGAPSRAQRLLRKRDVIYQTVRPYQRNNLFFAIEDERDYVASTGYAQLRAHASPAFLFQLLHTNGFVDRVLAKCTGSNYPAINSSDLAAIEVAVPSPPEQQKIADCLGSLDALIEAEGRKLAALRDHKRGLMQQLFPQPGQTQPRLRFPEFRDQGKWGESKLGKLVDISSGKSPSQYVLSNDGMYPFVKVEDLNNCTKYQVKSRDYCDDAGGVVPKGSILFPKRGAAIELNKIRITAVEILIDTNLMAITLRDSAASEFFFYYLDHVGLSQIADTSTIPQINNKHIIPFNISAPLRSEQQKIADCLSALDVLITAQAAKIDALKQHKRGLMQQLFPAPEEQ